MGIGRCIKWTDDGLHFGSKATEKLFLTHERNK